MTHSELAKVLKHFSHCFPDSAEKLKAKPDTLNTWKLSLAAHNFDDCKAAIDAIFSGKTETPYWEKFPNVIGQLCHAAAKDRRRFNPPERPALEPRSKFNDSIVEIYQFVRARMIEGLSRRDAMAEAEQKFSI